MSIADLHGRLAWIFAEDNFDIDLIIGVKNVKLTDIEELARVTMERYDKCFAQDVKKGDLLVGGHNFGYGHPHYPAMKAMRHLGVAGIIAESFSPGFFRGEISMGFPLATCPGILQIVTRWDELQLNWDIGTVMNLSNGQHLPIEKLSSIEYATLEAGGLIPYLKKMARHGADSPR